MIFKEQCVRWELSLAGLTLLLMGSLAFSVSTFAAGVHMIDVQGTINPGSAAYILESLADAEKEKAEAFLLKLNTPGGLLVSTRSIIQGISDSQVPVIVWISPGGASATSAGALITMAAHVAVMAPGSNIGAAHPVGSQGEDVKGTMGEKVTNDTAALARSLAALRGRNPTNAELIVTKSKSFTAEEAVSAKIVDYLAGSLDQVIALANGRKVTVERPKKDLTLSFGKLSAAEIQKKEMNLKQSFLHLIADPNVSAMLLALAGLAMWAEVSSGFTSIVAGVVAVFAFVLGLVSLQTLPINVGGALLLVLGFVLMVMEAFVTSYGLLSVGALAAIFLGGLFLIDPAAGSMRVSLSLLVAMVAGIGSVLLTIGFMLSREKQRKAKADPVVDTDAEVKSIEAGGMHGTAIANGEIWNFHSLEPVLPGDIRRVKSLEGLKITLERRT